MKIKILIGCIITIFLVISATFPSSVAFQITKTNDTLFNIINDLKERTNGGWYPGFFVELIIGTIFILLILLGILIPE